MHKYWITLPVLAYVECKYQSHMLWEAISSHHSLLLTAGSAGEELHENIHDVCDASLQAFAKQTLELGWLMLMLFPSVSP